MENQNVDQQNSVNQIDDYAATLMLTEKKDVIETQKALMEQGLNAESASIVALNLEQQIKEAKKERAKKDMLYRALWCIGGIVATVADIGFIFGGAIVFGGIQFFKGVANY